MKKQSLFICALFCAFVNWASGEPFIIGGVSIGFAFEDASLATNVRSGIAGELSAIWSEQPKALIDTGTNGDKRLFIDSLYASPIRGDVELPDALIPDGTNYNLRVPKVYSDVYVVAMRNYQTETNLIRSLMAFVTSLTPANLANASNEALLSLLSPAYKTTSLNDATRAALIDDLSASFYGTPSIIGITPTPQGAYGISDVSFTANIPGYDRETEDFVLVPAVFINGTWKLHPLF